jgi:predicted SprT family Zn-dependent metalloprotease
MNNLVLLDLKEKKYTNAGIPITSQLQALCITIEHELAHYLVKKYCKCDLEYHGKEFKRITSHFGHTKITHGMKA